MSASLCARGPLATRFYRCVSAGRREQALVDKDVRRTEGRAESQDPSLLLGYTIHPTLKGSLLGLSGSQWPEKWKEGLDLV